MEFPSTTSNWLNTFMMRDDNGMLCNNADTISRSSGESNAASALFSFELQATDIIYNDEFVLKNDTHCDVKATKTPLIKPPLEFQDHPVVNDAFAEKLAVHILKEAFNEITGHHVHPTRANATKMHVMRPMHQVYQQSYWTQDFLPFSPCHGGRPCSRNSFGSSRLSSSHNSLSVPAGCRPDDSSFITQAVSHDTLSMHCISDLYNVPFDSDVYAVPVDTVKPPVRPKKNAPHKNRRRNTASGFREMEVIRSEESQLKNASKADNLLVCATSGKRHSVAGTSAISHAVIEPVHMTLQEVRQYLKTLYSSSSDSSDHHDSIKMNRNEFVNINNNKYSDPAMLKTNLNNTCAQMRKKSTLLNNINNKRAKETCDNTMDKQTMQITHTARQDKQKKRTAKVLWLKQVLCNVFRFRRMISPLHGKAKINDADNAFAFHECIGEEDAKKSYSKRALPPLPGQGTLFAKSNASKTLDFTTSIRKVKDYGWYWGPLSSETAEKILSNEPAGSFIVRDSSDDHYIFSLTFKLNNTVRHVRIENDQGNFSFGSCTKFKSQTIVDFIENAVEHSRSGRYLFFLHRRPTVGPVRVQLLHPVSRFKQTQSLQHICRFVILKKVRKDLIPTLPLPRRIIDYLSSPHYYSEHLVDMEEIKENHLVTRNNLQETSDEY